jgi:hypothetical protein
MRIVVLGLQEVRVVVADQRQLEFLRKPDEVLVDRVLFRHMVLEFDEEAGLISAKCCGVPGCALDGRGPVLVVAAALVRQQVLADLAAEVAVDRDQALAVRREDLAVDPRLVVEALQKRGGAQVQEVVPACVVLRQQHEVKPPSPPPL